MRTDVYSLEEGSPRADHREIVSRKLCHDRKTSLGTVELHAIAPLEVFGREIIPAVAGF
jgi:hypothetical protein